MVKCTNAGGRTKGASEKSIVLVHQHGRDDVTWKPPIKQTVELNECLVLNGKPFANIAIKSINK